jgi:hypothetical protein
MKKFTLKAGEIVTLNGTPIRLTENAVFETHEDNLSGLFSNQHEKDRSNEQGNSTAP